MNPMYIDPYARIPRARHWLSSGPKKPYKQKNARSKHKKDPSISGSNHRKSRLIEKKFNADTIDTFCFHWPDMHSYVLVRVLEATIAILPVRSRVAFLYFNHAPLPMHPSPKVLRRALEPVANSHRIQVMFKSWKHTLNFEEEMSDGEEEHSEKSELSSPSIIDTPPSTPKTYASVTLADVLSNEPNLHAGWIHAPCTVKDNKDIYDNHLIVAAKHTELELTARCFTEKMMFMNLVKLKHGNSLKQEYLEKDTASQTAESTTTLFEDSDTEEASAVQRGRQLAKPMASISPNDMIQNLQRETTYQLETIYCLMEKVKRAKEDISTYSDQLVDLDQSFERLLDTALSIQFTTSKRELDMVNYQLANSITEFHLDRERIIQLQERVSTHSDFLTDASQRYEQIKKRVRNHVWSPWLYSALAGLVLLVSILLAYYNYYHKRIEEPSLL